MIRATRTVRGLSLLFLALGLVAFGYAGYVAIDASRRQSLARERLAHAPPAVAAVPPLVEGDPIGELRVDRLGLSTVVVQGESASSLRGAAGHLADTPLPGDPGNVVLAGHRDTVFRPLQGVRLGDILVLSTPHGVFRYQVESTVVVRPTDLHVLAASSSRTLTLITCFPFSYIGAAPNRFVIRARDISATARVKAPDAKPGF